MTHRRLKKIQSTVLNAEPRWMIMKTDLYQCSGPKMGAKINLINPNIDQMWLKKKKYILEYWHLILPKTGSYLWMDRYEYL